MAPSKEEADKAFDLFLETYRAKYPKAADCLAKDRAVLLTFYDFPAEHWAHIRTTNPIESTFATVRLRTAKTRGCLSRETAFTMVFKLCLSAQQHWRRLNGSNWLADVIEDIKFEDGVMLDRITARKPQATTFDNNSASLILNPLTVIGPIHLIPETAGVYHDPFQ